MWWDSRGPTRPVEVMGLCFAAVTLSAVEARYVRAEKGRVVAWRCSNRLAEGGRMGLAIGGEGDGCAVAGVRRWMRGLGEGDMDGDTSVAVPGRRRLGVPHSERLRKLGVTVREEVRVLAVSRLSSSVELASSKKTHLPGQVR
eukprot:CAMPEP_0175896206 /NCGR_PEP_ID=MMETSP0108-20121206/39_1 /TAXON_ID=195067 ORGANISM="Goniomonas pacifica, Strain CCMP1869" /NCGR_SAMPLE_ID=MMETSP0108 /ASSEMBLY_ACC=CAM_ASM_000204 /LENGTH=142 /DNA_ID=CAMNT_0017217375 /DNA_START=153 /DNA_END=581 /DNA_ORIENTATION=-